jgi:hypothetical protein
VLDDGFLRFDLDGDAWSETHHFPAAAVTGHYLRGLVGLRGKVNAAAFRGLPPGAARFEGASGLSLAHGWEVTFRFTRAGGGQTESGDFNQLGIDT